MCRLSSAGRSDDVGVDAALSVIGAERVDELGELWLALHRHHRVVSELQPLVEDDELSWTRRRLSASQTSNPACARG